MVIFEYVEMMNFMSVGSHPLRINLNEHQATAIHGKNGSGKSILVTDSLCFCLYNRPYRKITKPNLVNSINGKKCLVETCFTVNGKHYKVRRGIKPAVFEIYENDVLLNQEADARDYQKILEQQILRMNYRAFTQVVIIGSAAFVPFMKLDAKDRREFIEDLLDIKIFSVMNKSLSIKVKEVKDELKLLDRDIESQKEIIKLIESHVDSKKDELTEKKLSLKTEGMSLYDATKPLQDNAQELRNSILALRHEYDVATSLMFEYTSKKDSVLALEKKMTSLLSDLNNIPCTCVACHQDIPDEQKHRVGVGIQSQIDALTDKIKNTNVELVNIESKLIPVEPISDKMNAAIEQEQNLKLEINNNVWSIKRINQEMQSIQDELDKESPDKAKLKETAKKLVSMMTRKKDLVSTQKVQAAAQTLLQDTGIKATIIKQYVPTINKLVNKYLNHLDLFVNFTLDENFNEHVKSRHRDLFTYDSFSEGQKNRISLALIFTWRAIAAMKNSVNTNLIVLDEVADSGLDSDGFDACIDLFHSMKNNNIFVVSHRNIVEKFDHSIHIQMKNNFTEINLD